MAAIVLQVPDESLVPKVKQVCKMIKGVVSVKVEQTPRRRNRHPKTQILKAKRCNQNYEKPSLCYGSGGGNRQTGIALQVACY